MAAMVHLFNYEQKISGSDGPSKIKYKQTIVNGKVYNVAVWDVDCNIECQRTGANIVWGDSETQKWAHALNVNTAEEMASGAGNVASLIVFLTTLATKAGYLGDALSITKFSLTGDIGALNGFVSGKAAAYGWSATGGGLSGASRASVISGFIGSRLQDNRANR